MITSAPPRRKNLLPKLRGLDFSEIAGYPGALSGVELGRLCAARDILAAVREQDDVVSESEIEMVMNQAGCSRLEATEALERTCDVQFAILERRLISGDF